MGLHPFLTSFPAATRRLAEENKELKEKRKWIIEGNGGEYNHNTLYICMKL